MSSQDGKWCIDLMARLGLDLLPRRYRFIAANDEYPKAEFAVCDLRSGDRVGYTGLYASDPAGAHLELGLLSEPGCSLPGAGPEGAFLTINYAFSAWPIRKLYIRTSQASTAYFGGTLAAISRREGTLRDHVFFRGKHWDVYIAAIYRDDWIRSGQPVVDRLLRRQPVKAGGELSVSGKRGSTSSAARQAHSSARARPKKSASLRNSAIGSRVRSSYRRTWT